MRNHLFASWRLSEETTMSELFEESKHFNSTCDESQLRAGSVLPVWQQDGE
jgi:hypothetical protein